jgi:hypothetical protein
MLLWDTSGLLFYVKIPTHEVFDVVFRYRAGAFFARLAEEYFLIYGRHAKLGALHR